MTRDADLRRKYGITAADYDLMLYSQGGTCAICQRPPKTRRLHVDHDHKTGAIRGLLCHRCNRGLPFFGDDPVTLERAAVYLTGGLGLVASTLKPERSKPRRRGSRVRKSRSARS